MQRRAALLLPALLPGLAAAQAPRPAPPPARFIIPYGAGNITDQVARVLAEALVPRWGGRLVVDNQPGAGGVLGTLNLIRAAPDGSTFAMVSVAALAIVPHLLKPARYDPLTDLVPIAGVSVSSSFLVVNAALPVRSLAELVAYCRARPPADPVFYYSPGNATVPHLNLEALGRGLDFPMQHVPYRTSAAGNTDLLANRVQVSIDSLSITLPHIQAGTLRALAFNGTARHPLFPDVPTFAEAAPGVTLLNAWQGTFFPKGTPAPIVEATSRDILETISTPDFAAKLPVGVTPYVMGPAELAATIRSENARLGQLVAAIGLQQD
jgi:tripartite-type tricarboxylate transporter receptor subunit TctC